MANLANIVNGVTYREIGDLLRYYFPEAVIEVIPSSGLITIKALPSLATIDNFLFSDLTDQRGATTAQEYVESLANSEFFFRQTVFNPSTEVSFYNEGVFAMRQPIIERATTYPISNLRDQTTATGSATLTQVEGEYKIDLTADGADSLDFRTKERGRVMSHTSANAGISVRIPTLPTGNQFVEWLYFDDDNGIRVGVDATDLYISYYRGGVLESKTYRSSWTDPDGYASSIDLSKGLVFNLDFAYYGAGPLQISVYDINSAFAYKKYVIHQIKYTTGVNLPNPNLPLSVLADNDGTATALEVYVRGRQFSVVGKYDPIFRRDGQTGFRSSIGTTPTLIASFRRKSAFKQVNVLLEKVTIAPNGNAFFFVMSGNTLAGAVWGTPEYQDANETAIEVDTTSTTAIGGIKVDSGIAAGTAPNRVIVGQDVKIELENSDPISLYIASESGTISALWAAKFREEW